MNQNLNKKELLLQKKGVFIVQFAYSINVLLIFIE